MSRKLRFISFVIVAMLAAPLAVAFHDWAGAVRQARSMAASYAWIKAEQDFLDLEWAVPPTPGTRVTSIAAPPRRGPFSGYPHAVQVEVVHLWLPIFHRISGGPYPIRGRATVAVMRSKDGRWMPVEVE